MFGIVSLPQQAVEVTQALALPGRISLESLRKHQVPKKAVGVRQVMYSLRIMLRSTEQSELGIEVDLQTRRVAQDAAEDSCGHCNGISQRNALIGPSRGQAARCRCQALVVISDEHSYADSFFAAAVRGLAHPCRRCHNTCPLDKRTDIYLG